METTNIDGRFLILVIALLLFLFAVINQTLNIWLENQDHRKARAWDKEKCNQNFIDWFEKKVRANPLFLNTLIICVVPFIVLWMIIRHPVLFFLRAKEQFGKQINSALEYLTRR